MHGQRIVAGQDVSSAIDLQVLEKLVLHLPGDGHRANGIVKHSNSIESTVLDWIQLAEIVFFGARFPNKAVAVALRFSQASDRDVQVRLMLPEPWP